MITNDILVSKDLHEVETFWQGGMHFTANVQGHSIHMDKLPEHGGTDTGPRPKPYILAAASGCTGMELISILEKMRIKIQFLDIVITGRLGSSLPKIYDAVHIRYTIGCDQADQDRIQKAIALVEEKYCGVIAMIRHFAEFSSEVNFE